MKDHDQPDNFGPEERLRLQQLRIIEWLSLRKTPKRLAAKKDIVPITKSNIPEIWELTQGISLYDWQKQCVAKWFENGKRGTIKVVTGAGKTILALAIAERLHNEQAHNLNIAVVVPTIVLLNQWYEEFLAKTNIPQEAIGRLGGNYKDDYSDGRCVLICVLPSARKFLRDVVTKAGNQDRLLLIVDECHRIGATEMSQIFATQRTFNLGLSATPERDEDEAASDDNNAYNTSLTGKELGSIIFELTYAEALRLGIIPPFTVYHYGLPLNPQERQTYDQLTRVISEAKSELKSMAPSEASSGSAFYKWTRSMASRKSASNELANKFISDTNRRKELLYAMESRYRAVEELLHRELNNNSYARIILFHERIDEAMQLFTKLLKQGFPVVAENGELPESIREENLELFRKGIAQIMVSVKSLIEGFNVPAVDVGIIVASTSSVRQRIQSMGRVLRKHKTQGGEEKTSCIHILYAADTVDDFIYSKTDWEHATGLDKNIYYTWKPGEPPIQQTGPPRSPLPSDKEVEAAGLAQGDHYPGAYEGPEYSCDTAFNIQNSQGEYSSDASLAGKIISVKGSAGRFRVTPNKLHVLVRVPDPEEEWITKYVTTLERSLIFGQSLREKTTSFDIQNWVAQAKPGDIYPVQDVAIKGEPLYFRRRRGGVISLKVSNGEIYARVSEKANDKAKGQDAERVISAMKSILQHGENVNRMELNEHLHVLYRSQGQLKFVCALQAGLEFPALDLNKSEL